MAMRARRRPLPGWMATLVVVAVGVLIFLPEPARRVEAAGHQLLAPLQFGVSRLLGQVQDVAGIVRQVGDLARQNDQYRDEIDRLQAEIARLRELEVENRDLRNLLGLKQRPASPALLPVRVIARDPSPYVQVMTIDRGTGDGIRDGMPVIAWRGVAGRVTRAGPTSSKVLLITDVNSSISGRIQSSDERVSGTIRGRPEGGLLMQYIPQEESVQPGDTVVTSDLGDVMPEGLVLGQITQIRRRDVDVFQEAVIEPAADLRRLEHLYVLADPEPTR